MKATSNNVPEIIEDNEDAVGRPYERYGGYPGYKYNKAETGNNDKNFCACSRSSSKASRKGAFFY